MFALFKIFFFFFFFLLRNRSLSNARWFCSKKRNNGKGNLYLTENQFGRNKNYLKEDNHNYMVTWVKKNSQIRASTSSYWNRIFIELPQISHIDKKSEFFSYNCIFFIRTTSIPSKWSMREILFFFDKALCCKKTDNRAACLVYFILYKGTSQIFDWLIDWLIDFSININHA